jgi:biopolymer transport protein ExbD
MATKQGVLDVWIVEMNTVYKQVPFTVVIDWIQQGRLLEDDQVREGGNAQWARIGATPSLAPYLPRPEPQRPADEAEALEPVQLEFSWKKPEAVPDEEVDMIPLIDVSLVLLIFFILTASGAMAGAFVPTPEARYAGVSDTAGVSIFVNLEGEGRERVPVYSLGEEGRPSADPKDRDLRTRAELLERLDVMLARKTDRVEVTIFAHRDLESGLVDDLTVELGKRPRRDKIRAKYTGVQEK